MVEACTNHMYCVLEKPVGGRVKKHRKYSGAKCRIAELWFSVNANCFVGCVFALESAANSNEHSK
jgi:hypothetical protein